MGKIIITGYPYAYPYYFEVFEYVQNKNEFVFVLPKIWKAKAGKVNIKLEAKAEFKTYRLKTISFGGRGWRGWLKGGLPGLIFMLPYLKLRYKSRVLYSCLEPNLLTTFFNGIMAKLCGLKHVLFTWQNVPSEQRMHGTKLRLSNALVRLNLRLADGVICGNQKAERIIIKLFVNRRTKAHHLKTMVCPLSGVDTNKFRSDPNLAVGWKKRLGLENSKMILFYGALEKRKGLDSLLLAFRTLNNGQLPMAKLVMVGTGPEQKSLKQQVQNLNLQNQIIFLDWMPNSELPALLNAADIFVCPSIPVGGWEEQFGYAMAEASAGGVPVVATKTGSIEEVVRSGQSGILVEPDNPLQLAEALSRLLSNEALAKQMGQFGRQYVVNNFSHQVVSQKITQFLETI